MLVGATQVNTTCEDEVLMLSLVKAVEAFGTLGIVAPFPDEDSAELPREF